MKHIAFTIDRKFVRFCAVTMVSVMENDNPADLTFHIIANDLLEEDRKILSGLVQNYGSCIFFYQVPAVKMAGYTIRWEKKRLSEVVFYRCLLASILPDSISKVLYLDCDILVLQPLDELWNTDIENKVLAAIPDSYQVNVRHCRRLEYDISYNYFNGGVLLLNLAYWRQYHLEERCKAFYQAHPDKILYNDQDLLNGLFYDQKVLVDMKWNVQEGAYRIPKGRTAHWCPPYIETLKHPAILHYSARKPWQYHCMHPLRNLYLYYQKLTPWKDEHVLNHYGARIHRFLHMLPYTLHLKKGKYLDIHILGF